MNEPNVHVGILSAPKVEFVFPEPYVTEGKEVSGIQTAAYDNGKIRWQDGLYDELLFEPSDKGTGEFELKDVTIGIGFHWERKEDQRFRGALKIIVEDKKLTGINIVGTEDYLVSVISSEMSATASLELLKAHAVISRSWLLNCLQAVTRMVSPPSLKEGYPKGGVVGKLGEKQLCSTYHPGLQPPLLPEGGESMRHPSLNMPTFKDNTVIRWYDRQDHARFDVCADDHCQRYQGTTRASTNMVRQAVAATRGQTLMYDGQICDARFSKCCGGAFEEFPSCWEDVEHPYLVKQRDSKAVTELPDLRIEAEAERWIRSSPEAYCNTTDKNVLSQVLNNYDQETVNFYRWKVEYTQKELSELILRRSGVDFGDITDMIPIERGTSARLVKLKIVGSKRTLTIGKELEIRRTLSPSHLYSSAFVVDKAEIQNGLPGKFILTGAGWGHGVGLCQIGAAVMGEQGHAYKDILLHYYKGADIEKLYD